MVHYFYFLYLLFPIPFYFAILKRVHRKSFALAITTGVNTFLFSCWDIFGNITHIWHTNIHYVLGIFLFYEYPLEELFFLISTTLFAITLYFVIERYV